jgi:hypothetical protein
MEGHPSMGLKYPGGRHGTSDNAYHPALPSGKADIQIYLDFTVEGSGLVNGVPWHESASSQGLKAAGKTPTVVDLGQAPLHKIAFYAKAELDAMTNAPNFMRCSPAHNSRPPLSPISANLFGDVFAPAIDAFGLIHLDLPLFGSSFGLIL